MLPVRRAYFHLSSDLLKQALHMPEDCKVIGADWDFAGDCLKIYIEHDELPEVPVGQCLPIVWPTIKKELITLDEEAKITYKYTWKFT